MFENLDSVNRNYVEYFKGEAEKNPDNLATFDAYVEIISKEYTDNSLRITLASPLTKSPSCANRNQIGIIRKIGNSNFFFIFCHLSRLQ